MTWLIQLFTTHSAAQAVVVLGLAIALGLALGQIRFFGVRLGVGGVLFSGLAIAHFGLSLEHNVLEFAREFGLILFVYSIGMQVGPGFVDSLRRRGFRLNAMATLIVLLGVLLTVAFHLWGGVPLDAAVGLFSGAVTNTPSLAAATQAFKEASPALAEQAVGQAGLAYAVAYPFGIFGIILVMLLVKRLFRIDPAEELRRMEEQAKTLNPPLETMTIEIANTNLDDMPLGAVPGAEDMGVVVSRVQADGIMQPAAPETRLKLGMLIHAVGRPAELEKFRIMTGTRSAVDLPQAPGPLEVRHLVVSRRQVLGKTAPELHLAQKHGVTITRIQRSGTEFSAGPEAPLHFGDMVACVGAPEGLAAVERLLGNSAKDLDHPRVLPIFVGILLGAVLGSFPVAFPGLPSGVKLGVAGGPLLMSILLSRLHYVGGMLWYMPQSANLILREVGISLFLACVGLKAGDRFADALASGAGLYWLLVGACITFIPLLVAGVIGRVFLKCNYASMCGLLAGAMTDPPALAFAGQTLGSDAPASVYATVYPLVMILRILAGQLLVLLLFSG
jgi:putative transport protein